LPGAHTNKLSRLTSHNVNGTDAQLAFP
jgi:hypothetical protein